MLGMEAAALVCEENSYLDLVYPADRPRYTEFLNRLRKGDISTSTEYRLVRGDGRILEVRDQASSWCGRDEAGQSVVFCDSVLTDITDLKRKTKIFVSCTKRFHADFRNIPAKSSQKLRI